MICLNKTKCALNSDQSAESFTLERGAGLSPVTESTIQFSELPDVQLLNSGAPDEV